MSDHKRRYAHTKTYYEKHGYIKEDREKQSFLTFCGKAMVGNLVNEMVWKSAVEAVDVLLLAFLLKMDFSELILWLDLHCCVCQLSVWCRCLW